jgi:hypothetical protein
MAPYQPKITPDIEEHLEKEGFDPFAEVVPSKLGVPVATGLTHDAWLEEAERFFDDDELTPADTEEELDEPTP